MEILGSDPLAVITGEEDQRPDVQLLLALLEDAPQGLHTWVRTSGPHGVPLDLLKRQDFAAFEDALADLAERGFIIRRPDPDASRRARPR